MKNTVKEKKIQGYLPVLKLAIKDCTEFLAQCMKIHSEACHCENLNY